MRKSTGDREALDAFQVFLRYVESKEREITGTMDIGPVRRKPEKRVFGSMSIGPVRNRAGATRTIFGSMDIGPVTDRRK